MLTVVVLGPEMYDETSETFVTKDDITLNLEHSLISLSKWESIFEKPFLGKDEKTTEEVLEYVKCMTVSRNIPEETYQRLSEENVTAINKYIERPMSATWFSDTPGAPASRDIITAELIYYWMITFNIPFECEKWHLNRLFTLIRVCSVKQAKPKKMSRSEIAARNRELNARRKAQLGTTG